jgi:hypothetical protein
MSKVKELKRKQINKAAANYLCDQEEGDFYDAYNVLLNVPEEEENNPASIYITVWQPLETISVKEMIDLIDSSIENEPKVPEFIKKIDWKLLREQKNSLLHIIDTDWNKLEILPDSLQGIVNLIDSIQDYAVDTALIADEEEVFDSEDKGTYGAYIDNEKQTKEVWLCSACNSDNVQYQVWENPNTGKLESILHEGKACFCKDCQKHTKLYKAELKADSKIIGYQVVGGTDTKKEGAVHPDMDASFCVYSLPQCDKMIKNGEGWVLLTIWEGDIEEPTMMFSGDPRG